jgi:hypothetical protein
LHEQGLVSVLQSLHDELDAAVLQAYGWSDLGAVPWADEAARAAWTETLLERLVALNARRAAEEAAGTIRWLRPDFQDPARRAALAAAQAAERVAAQAAARAQASDTPQPAGAAGHGLPIQEQDKTMPRWEQAHLGMKMPDIATPAAPVPPGTGVGEGDDGFEGSEGGAAPATPLGVPTAQPWPATLPEQVRALALLLATAPTALPLSAIEARFKGRGPWKKSLPRILDTLEALGRARREGDGWRG